MQSSKSQTVRKLLRFIGKNSTNIRVAYKEKLEKLHEEPMGNVEQEYEDMRKKEAD